jgi:hypothetical protein
MIIGKRPSPAGNSTGNEEKVGGKNEIPAFHHPDSMINCFDHL